MKNLFIYLLVITSISLIGCNKDDSSEDNNGTSADQIASIAEDGTWHISYFFDTDEDETSNFNGFTFTFGANGTIVASNGTNTIEGTWSVLDGSSNSSTDDDGNSSDDDDFNIFFNVPANSDFEDLNDDWDIIEVTASKIELIDISGGNGGTDYLTFTKN